MKANKTALGTSLLIASTVLCAVAGCANASKEKISTADENAKQSALPIARIPHPGSAAEAYFSPDGKSLICNAKLEGDEVYQVYTIRLDGTHALRINDHGDDACSYYFPDGRRLIWTSTRDRGDLPKGDYSKTLDYPQGAELYTSALDGSDVQRLTNNSNYDAEVSVSPDGKWILFTRQINGQLDMWKMNPDGSNQVQITRTPDLQEGGAFFMPDSKTIIYRAWKIEADSVRGKPMQVFTIKLDGTGRRQITHEEGTNWAPYPAPDGKHFAFVKMLPPHNFEVFLMNMETSEQRRLTFNEAFDGYPAISPDGRTIVFCSSRDVPKGQRKLFLYRMDIASLNIGARGR